MKNDKILQIDLLIRTMYGKWQSGHMTETYSTEEVHFWGLIDVIDEGFVIYFMTSSIGFYKQVGPWINSYFPLILAWLKEELPVFPVLYASRFTLIYSTPVL